MKYSTSSIQHEVFNMKKLLRLSLFLSLLLGLVACDSGVDKVVVTEKPETVAAPALPDGITHIETVAGGNGEISIPYSKYRLANGLTVVLHEDHSDPLVHVDVTYHVGSNREEAGRSGFAHFFEHMMFQGSANVADEQHFKVVSNAGGTLNGTTNSDRTNYYETLPVNQLETALWLEADRMGFLLEAVTREKFEIQRETVKNERGQSVDNQPYGRVGETIQKNLYPVGHPYSWPVIGWIEDLNRADVDDLKRFFLHWYGPNNAVVTIGGDIDKMETLELVNKYFGSIPAGPEVEDLPKQPGELESDRYVTLEDNIHLPAIALLIPTVYGTHEDEAALDAAAKILGQGQASLLYQRLVQTGRAVQAVVQHSCRELACEMTFIVVQHPGSGETLAEMETAIRETLIEFAERPVSEDDLQRFKAEYESSRVFGLQSVSGKVSTLAAFETYTNNPNGIADELDRYLSVTAEDVNRVFSQYITDQPAIILSIVPNGQTQLVAAPDNFETPERNIPESFGDEDAELPLRPVADNFDRSLAPVPGANPGVDLPPIWDTKLANGVRLLAVTNDETPTVTIQASFEMGLRDEPPGKAGLTALTTSLMTEATTERSAAEFAEELERIGASVSVNSGNYQTTITVNTLSKNLDQAVALMMERLLMPDFTQEDFDRVKSQTLEGLMHERKTPQGLAGRAVGAVMLGTEHPLSFPQNGLPETVEAITLDDVKAYYAAHIPSHLSGVLVSAGLPQDDMLKAVQGLADLPVEAVYRETVAGMNEIEGRTIYLVDKQDAAQSSVRLRQPSIKYDALGDYYKGGLMNFNLGGTFNSRVNLNLREDKGYTYGARSRFRGDIEMGSFGVSAEVNKEATAASVTEMLNELESYATDGMTEEEYDYMRSAIGQRDALQYETPGRKMRLLRQIMRYDLPLNYRKLQQNILRETDRESLNVLAAILIDPENLAIVVVGDEATIRPELEALGLPIKKLDESGHPVEVSD